VGGWRAQGVDSGVLSRCMVKTNLQISQLVDWLIDRKMIDQLSQNASNNQSGNRSRRSSRSSSLSHNQPIEHLLSQLLDQPNSQSNNQVLTQLLALNQSTNQSFKFPYSLPGLLMAATYQIIKRSGEIAAGSTTCCILTFSAFDCSLEHPDDTLVDWLIGQFHQVKHQRLMQKQSVNRPLKQSDDQTIDESQMPLSGSTTEDQGTMQSNKQSIKEPAADDVDLPLSGSVSEDHDQPGNQSIVGEGELRFEHCEPLSISQSLSVPTRQSSAVPSTPLPSPSNDQSTSQSINQGTNHPSAFSPSSLWKMLSGKSEQSTPRSGNQSPVQSSRSVSQSVDPPPFYMNVATLGDSGFFLLRNKRWIDHSSNQSTTQANTPSTSSSHHSSHDSPSHSDSPSSHQPMYQVVDRSPLQREGRIVKQLAMIPPELADASNCYCNDLPNQAINQSIKVLPDDIIIAGSDGLLDNLVDPYEHSPDQSFEESIWDRWWAQSNQSNQQSNFDQRCSNRIQEIVNDVYNQSINQTPSQSVKQSDDFVHRLCARLVSEASTFMQTSEGKPDDLTICVAQVNLVQ